MISATRGPAWPPPETFRQESSSPSGEPPTPRACCSGRSNWRGALGFSYDTGLYLQFRATEADDFQLAYAATLSEASDYAAAERLVGELIDKRPGWLQARWLRVAICQRTERWSDVVRLLTPVVTDASLDDVFAHAARVTLGIALARLGMVAPALSYLEEPAGPVAVAAVDGALAKALSLRAQGEDDDANDLLQELYAANPENAHVEEALTDPTFGLVTTTAARIDARTHPWDPSTEPSEAEFVDPGAKERKAHLLIEAEAELAEFIGLDEVKYQVARLKSSVAMALRRQERGLGYRASSRHGRGARPFHGERAGRRHGDRRAVEPHPFAAAGDGAGGDGAGTGGRCLRDGGAR